MSTPIPLPPPLSTLKDFVTKSLPQQQQQPTQPTPITLTRQQTIEGDDHMIFLPNESPQYILRVTKPRKNRAYNGQEMQTRDIRLRRLFQSECHDRRGLSGDVIPCSVATGSLSDDGVYELSLETRLGGADLDNVSVTEETVRGFVDFLSILKGIDAEGLEAKLGVMVPCIPFPDLRMLRKSAIDAWGRLVERGQVSSKDFPNEDNTLEDLIKRKTAFMDLNNHNQPLIEHPSNKSNKRVLVHNDIKGEHILVNPETGRITGILDWADAGIGNPATDIAGLVLTIGTKSATRIAREVGYGESEIQEGILQARFECVLRLDDRLNGHDRFSPVDLLRKQLFVSLRDC